MNYDPFDTSVERLYVLYQDESKTFGYTINPDQANRPGIRIFAVADVNSWEISFHDGEKLQLDDFDELHSYLIDIMEKNRNASQEIRMTAMAEDTTVGSVIVEDWREQWAILGGQVKELFLGRGQNGHT